MPPASIRNLIRPLEEPGQVVADYPGFKQRYWFDAVGHSIVWTRWEREVSGVDPLYKLTGDYSLNGFITALDARQGGDELYVAASSPNGSVRVDRWYFPPRMGGWHHLGPSNVPPLGTPAGPYVGVTSIVGGTFIAPSTQRHVTPVRTTVYTDESTNSGIRALAVDPEGRFLVLLDHATSDVRQIVLGSGPPYTQSTILTAAEVPELASMDRMYIAEHTSFGRVLGLHERHAKIGDHSMYALLFDVNNDGVFESHQTYTIAEWRTNRELSEGGRWKPTSKF